MLAQTALLKITRSPLWMNAMSWVVKKEGGQKSLMKFSILPPNYFDQNYLTICTGITK
jgi:hypothetical protein